MRKALSLGQVEQITGVSTDKLRLLCNKGTLKCFLVPDSKHRRITPSDLYRFMLKYDIPIGPLLDRFPELRAPQPVNSAPPEPPGKSCGA